MKFTKVEEFGVLNFVEEVLDRSSVRCAVDGGCRG
jgi:hypothetical protein